MNKSGAVIGLGHAYTNQDRHSELRASQMKSHRSDQVSLSVFAGRHVLVVARQTTLFQAKNILCTIVDRIGGVANLVLITAGQVLRFEWQSSNKKQ